MRQHKIITLSKLTLSILLPLVFFTLANLRAYAAPPPSLIQNMPQDSNIGAGIAKSADQPITDLRVVFNSICDSITNKNLKVDKCKSYVKLEDMNDAKADLCKNATDKLKKKCDAYDDVKSGRKSLEDVQSIIKKTEPKTQLDCDMDSSPLSWIICPAIDMGVNSIDYFFKNIITPLLENTPISSSKDDATFVTWQTFRIFGNIVLVGSLLLMVFAQNMGRFVDAYTIKKMAPRIVIGAIAINISFYLCLIAIDVTNVLGNGMSQIISAPFMKGFENGGDIGIDPTAINNVAGVLGVVSLAGILASGSIVLAPLLLFILPIIVTILLVSLAVVFTIIIRQALLILLTAVSAIAIACFILPGTEKYFKRWWDLFLKTLLVYPIIAIIFAMSNVMGGIILGSATGGLQGLAQILTVVLVVYSPLVLIPFSFKLAGGAIGAVFDMANKRALSSSGSIGKRIGESANNPDSLFGKLRNRGRSRKIEKGLGLGDIAAGLGGMRKKNRPEGISRGQGWRNARTSRREAQGAALAAQNQKSSIYAAAASASDEAQLDMAKYGSKKDSLAAINNGTHISYSREHQDIARRIAAGEQVSNAERQSLMARQSQLASYSALNDAQGRTLENRKAAAQSQAAVSYGYANGREGWDQAVDIAKDLYNGDETAMMSHMNSLQYVASQVGRSDLSGNVNSLDYNSLRAGQKVPAATVMSQSKPAAVTGIVNEQLGILNSNASYKEKYQAAKILSSLRAGANGPYANEANKQALADQAMNIDSAVESFLQDEDMHAQAAVAAMATDPAVHAENIFAETQQSTGVTATYGTGKSEGAFPDVINADTPVELQREVTRTISGADAGRAWFRAQSGRRLSETEIAESQRRANEPAQPEEES